MEEHSDKWFVLFTLNSKIHTFHFRESLPTEDEIRFTQTFNTVYVVEGFLLSSINFFLIISVLKSSVTSAYKEYIIFCGKVSSAMNSVFGMNNFRFLLTDFMV